MLSHALPCTALLFASLALRLCRYDDDADEELLKLIPFLEKVAHVNDVRPHIQVRREGGRAGGQVAGVFEAGRGGEKQGRRQGVCRWPWGEVGRATHCPALLSSLSLYPPASLPASSTVVASSHHPPCSTPPLPLQNRYRLRSLVEAAADPDQQYLMHQQAQHEQQQQQYEQAQIEAEQGQQGPSSE